MLKINKLMLSFVLLLFVPSVSYTQDSKIKKNNNNYTWQYLIKDDSTDGWHNYLGGKPAGWKVKDGILYSLGNGGDIVTDEQYENFELSLEWKIKEKGNSGVFYYVVEEPQNKMMYETGLEFQIIDNINYPQQLTEQQKTGALSDVIAPKNAKVNPVGEWNSTKIVANKGVVEHWLNGKMILKFVLGSEQFKKQIAASKFADLPYAESNVGRIGLQDHGDPIYYRNIKIRRI